MSSWHPLFAAVTHYLFISRSYEAVCFFSFSLISISLHFTTPLTVTLPLLTRTHVRTFYTYGPRSYRAMCAANRSSLEISYVHLGEMHALLAIWLTDLPKEMLQIFDEVLYKEVLVLFPHYAQVTTEIF